jgi:hypothetical protein
MKPLPLQTIKRNYFFTGSILYIPVPQSEHFPFKAGRPFFMVTFWPSLISFFALHFTQYAISAICSPLDFRLLFGFGAVGAESNGGHGREIHYLHRLPLNLVNIRWILFLGD